MEFLKNSDWIFMAVTDSGPGIPESEMGRLFNKFSQAKNVFAKKGGTGLGLAVCKNIIDSHNGIIGAETVEEKGSTFYFALPVV